jgi:hypothetical protein
MGALRLINAAPEEVILLGVQPASTDWGTVFDSDKPGAFLCENPNFSAFRGWCCVSGGFDSPLRELRKSYVHQGVLGGFNLWRP